MQINPINNQTRPKFNAKFRYFECPMEKVTKETKDILSKKALESITAKVEKLGTRDDFVAISLVHDLALGDKIDYDSSKVYTKILANHFFINKRDSIFYGEIGTVYGDKSERASKTKTIIEHYIKMLETSLKK